MLKAGAYEPWMRRAGGLLLIPDLATGLAVVVPPREAELAVAALSTTGLDVAAARTTSLLEVARPSHGLATTDLAAPGLDVRPLATTSLQYAPEE